MLEPTSLAQFLQFYGGWGLSAVLIVAIVALYRHMGNLLERRNEQFMELLRENVALLEQNAATNARLEDLIEVKLGKLTDIDWEKFSKELDELHDWHSVSDGDGVKVWYVKQSLGQKITDLANSFNEMKTAMSKNDGGG